MKVLFIPSLHDQIRIFANSCFLSKNPEVFHPSIKPAHSQKYDGRDNYANHLISIPLTAPD